MNRKPHGITLLELMLVLVIMAVFAVMGVNMMQQHMREAQLDQTSIQMQQILHAGLAYYINHGNWPASMSVLYNEGYLPGNEMFLSNSQS